ncbi:hypothetical protein HZQ01_14205 [Elizabethkingia anophelis]|nr:hypothetical protein [Elizabethkingia anophelis]
MDIKKIGVDGNDNLTAGRDLYYTNAVNSDSEIGIINEIFDFVVEKANQREIVPPPSDRKKLIMLEEKIKLNFKDEGLDQFVKEYFTRLYKYMTWVDKCFQSLPINTQEDIENYIFILYNELKTNKMDNSKILKELPNNFLPPSHSKNPLYVNISHAIVLFFFDDCTIFEKTKQEKNNGKIPNLFDDL